VLFPGLCSVFSVGQVIVKHAAKPAAGFWRTYFAHRETADKPPMNCELLRPRRLVRYHD
jgi:hypothetical protein